MKKKPAPAKVKKAKKVSTNKKEKKIVLKKNNFSKDKKFFNLGHRFVNLHGINTLDIKLIQNPKVKEGDEEIVIERPYRVIAVMQLGDIPCWDFATAKEAEEFVDQIWSFIK